MVYYYFFDVFSVLVNYYFQVFFNLEVILNVAKIPWTSSFNGQYFTLALFLSKTVSLVEILAIKW